MLLDKQSVILGVYDEYVRMYSIELLGTSGHWNIISMGRNICLFGFYLLYLFILKNELKMQ